MQIHSHIKNEKGPVPTVAAGSTDQPTTNPEMKLYEVQVVAEFQMSLTGYATVYAADADEAVEKVQAKIDDGSLDDDLEMEDFDSGHTMPYGEVTGLWDVDIQTGGVDIIEEHVDPFEVLKSEVEDLQASVSWNTDALAKHKAFLESLLGHDEQAVTA